MLSKPFLFEPVCEERFRILLWAKRVLVAFALNLSSAFRVRVGFYHSIPVATVSVDKLPHHFSLLHNTD